MTTAVVITTWLNGIALALTPVERWEAAGRFNTNFMTEHWFTMMMVVVIVVLTALLVVISYQQMLQRRKVSGQLFVEYAERVGLSWRERQILLDIAGQAGLKRSEAIFTMGSAFDRGAAKIIEKALSLGQTDEESKQLKMELSFLREKLGFQNRRVGSIGTGGRSRKFSSRQIPVGKKLHITRRRSRTSGDIESTVIENNDTELKVKFTTPVKVSPGEFWCVRYYFGSSVCEFDTSVVSCKDDILVLNHSDDVRFVNRRRFLRVPVRKPAFVGRFPFTRTLPAESDISKEGSESGQVSGAWGPPEFVPGVVTELAGPGLRIEVPLEVEVGDRVLVVFKLDEEVPARRNGKASGLRPSSAECPSRIVEDIGEVRHISSGRSLPEHDKAMQNGLSIAVELTGLSDTDVSELIRATNAASMKGGTEGQDIVGSVNSESESVAMRGEGV